MDFDCIVIGAGHAGVEAGLASARMGLKTAMVTFSKETIGQMSCNPAIGGVGKGQLVKEIDALGGQMGLAADTSGIQFRQLNASKGQAVRSSRCQADRKQYRLYMQQVVLNQSYLTVIEDEVSELLVAQGAVQGLKTLGGLTLLTKTIVIATGTFLDGRIHMGPQITSGGRIGEKASINLAQSIRDLGFEVLMFKTGTPPRLDGRTIDFSGMERQDSDEPIVPFSFRTPFIPRDRKLLPCYITRTTERTHEIIKANFHLSPMYSGQIKATGVRYCPSIEDKLKKFAERQSHHVFLEPEGLDTDEYYPNGISTGLPALVQEDFVHSIPGLEKAAFVRYGYSIEHGVIPATELKSTLETKKIKGLFLAGQINGTTGYEEAAAQGLMAGINASLHVLNKEPFILGRHESYIGVLIDDLTTKGTEEPYRMFTSRVEYRLIVREDNADKRLSAKAHDLGLLSDEDYGKVMNKYDLIAKEIDRLQQIKVAPGALLDEVLEKASSAPLKQAISLYDLIKRPEIYYEMLAGFDDNRKDLSADIMAQIEYEIKYEGFIRRQLKEVEKFRHIEHIRIPEGFDFKGIPGLSKEIIEKLNRFNPANLGQANRISGVTPAAIAVLMVYLKKWKEEHGRR
ncbi:MAG: tRNA uridine-5-carboxymethylaminomethyl(34) synthesis enzyme MnmG [Candidatus Omnitrophica bacterium]|nr:tRNA uridine-5-carboxymethylaminomethyl(34) synthesis enzyme MnmG [Candidatus Omnitrophota bacterium]